MNTNEAHVITLTYTYVPQNHVHNYNSILGFTCLKGIVLNELLDIYGIINLVDFLIPVQLIWTGLFPEGKCIRVQIRVNNKNRV